MINVMDKIKELLANLYDVDTVGRDIKNVAASEFIFDDIDKTELELELEIDLDVILPESARLTWSTFGELEKLVEAELG